MVFVLLHVPVLQTPLPILVRTFGGALLRTFCSHCFRMKTRPPGLHAIPDDLSHAVTFYDSVSDRRGEKSGGEIRGHDLLPIPEAGSNDYHPTARARTPNQGNWKNFWHQHESILHFPGLGICVRRWGKWKKISAWCHLKTQRLLQTADATSVFNAFGLCFLLFRVWFSDAPPSASFGLV